MDTSGYRPNLRYLSCSAIISAREYALDISVNDNGYSVYLRILPVRGSLILFARSKLDEPDAMIRVSGNVSIMILSFSPISGIALQIFR
jgi:hypothetical protein